MSNQAWTFLFLAWGAIFLNVGYCFWKLLTSKKSLGDDREE